MSLPPCLMRLKIIDAEHYINIWLPLFLAWIILGILMIAISPIIAVLVLILWPFGWGEFLLMIGPVIYHAICALKGLTVDVKNRKETVLIYFR